MDRGEFRSCCRTPAVKISEEELNLGIDAFLNSPEQKQSRLALLKGERHPDCQSCWNLEDAGTTSPRHGPEKFWDHLTRQGHVNKLAAYNKPQLLELLSHATAESALLESYTPYMVEINIGSTCDMKCMYCTHHYSTQWAAERIKYGEITQSQYDTEFPKAPPNFDEKFWEWFNSIGRFNVTRLGVIGGEPLIMPEFYTFVDKLITSMAQIPERKQKMVLWLVTNMNTPSAYLEKFLKYLPKLTEIFDVEVLVSMESVGKKAEYIRNGVNWNRFTGNLDKLLSRKELKFNFGFILSLNALNITSLQDFIIFTEQLYHLYGRPVGLKQNIISFPDWETPTILTPDFAEYLDKCILYMRDRADSMPLVPDKLACWAQYATFLETIATSIRSNISDRTAIRKKFAEWFDTYDIRRKTNLVETFPEYTEFYNLCRRTDAS